jgi:hypothetical protein
MPKAMLSFNLPDETEEFNAAKDGGLAFSVINEYFNYLRTLSKYEDVTTISVEEAREELLRLMKYHDLEIYL